jgi:hypothetical protein
MKMVRSKNDHTRLYFGTNLWIREVLSVISLLIFVWGQPSCRMKTKSKSRNFLFFYINN